MRLIERIAHMALVLLGVSVLMFALVRVLPGDPLAASLGEGVSKEQVAQARAQLGLDRPLPVQYVHYVRDLLQGRLGHSLLEKRDVGEIVSERLPATLELVFAALGLAILAGVPIGVMSAIHRDGGLDHAGRLITLAGVSFPEFWLALMLQLLLGAWLALLPITGRIGSEASGAITGFYLVDSVLTLNFSQAFDAARHLALPAFILALGPMTNIARMVRGSMLDELGKPYAALSRAVGIHPAIVNYKYVLRNAFSSTLTMIGYMFPVMISGSFVVEKVFAWPGIGRFGADAIVANDYNSVVGVTLVICVFVVVVNFLVDELYAVLDPRMRIER